MSASVNKTLLITTLFLVLILHAALSFLLQFWSVSEYMG